MRVIALYNIKGGVGKTAAAVNLAWLSADAGARTLLWDLDPQGASTFYFRVEPRIRHGLRKLLRGRRPLDDEIRATDWEGLDLLPAARSLRRLDRTLGRTDDPEDRLAALVASLARDYDHVWLDCAPGLDLAARAVFRAADALLVPTIPTTLSLRTLDQIAEHLDRHTDTRVALLPFFSMVDRRRGLHREVVAGSAGRTPPLLASAIPASSVVERMGPRRAPLFAYAATGEPARAYRALWREALTATGSVLGWSAE